MKDSMGEFDALRLISLKGNSSWSCVSRVNLHEINLKSIVVNNEIDPEHASIHLLSAKIITQTLGMLEYFPPNSSLDLWILEIVSPHLVPTESSSIWSQFFMTNDLSMYRSNNSSKLPCNCSDPKCLQPLKRHNLLNLWILELCCIFIVILLARDKVSRHSWKSYFGLND